MTTVNDCRIVNLFKTSTGQNNTVAVEGRKDVPFDITRVYYIYEVPEGGTRGGHAHKKLQQLIVSVKGSFDVTLDDGRKGITVTLNRTYSGLYIPKLIWSGLANFSFGAICLVLASMPYDENDYIRDYNEFFRIKC